MEGRMTVCNMAIEAGGKNGIIAADDKTIEYVRSRTDKPFEPVQSDPDAVVEREATYAADELEPCVAEPHLPSNYAPARERGDVAVDDDGRIVEFREKPADAAARDGMKVQPDLLARWGDHARHLLEQQGITRLEYTYFDETGAQLATVPLNATDRAAVRHVNITIEGETDRGEPVSYTTRVTLRNG